MTRVVWAHRLASLLLQDRIVAGVYPVVAAHRLKSVGRTHQQRVRVRLDEDANVVLAILLGGALHQAHLHVTVGRVPSQPLLLGQVSQAQIVHEISEIEEMLPRMNTLSSWICFYSRRFLRQIELGLAIELRSSVIAQPILLAASSFPL